MNQSEQPEKRRGIQPNPEFEKAVAQMTRNGMHKDVRKAFEALNNALLLAMASDWTSEKDTVLYAQLARTITELEGFANEAFLRN